MCYVRSVKNVLIALASLSLLAGCNNADEVCRDLVNALAEKTVECGGAATVEEAAAAIEDSLENPSGCDGIAGISDEELLYETCIPSIESSGCGADIHPSCRDQLIYIRR